MPLFTVEEAQNKFVELIALAKNGEEILIADGQNGFVQLIALSRQERMRTPGMDEGLFVVPDDFDDPLPVDILEGFGV